MNRSRQRILVAVLVGVGWGAPLCVAAGGGDRLDGCVAVATKRGQTQLACVNVVRGEFQLEIVEPARSRLRRVYGLGKAEPSKPHPPQGPLQRVVSTLLRRGFRRLDVTLADAAAGVAAVKGSACGLAVSKDEQWIVTVSPSGRAPWMAVGGPGGHPRLVALSLDRVSGRLYLVVEHLHDDGIRLRQVKTAALADVLARKECRVSPAVSSPRRGDHAQPDAQP